jgi:hypothetical protein
MTEPRQSDSRHPTEVGEGTVWLIWGDVGGSVVLMGVADSPEAARHEVADLVCDRHFSTAWFESRHVIRATRWSEVE